MGERVLKLEASAGSGKTYRLVQTFLERLFATFAFLPEPGGDSAEKARRLLPTVLAVTFTIKAANEMKARILDRLQQLALLNGGRPLPDAEARAGLADLEAATGLEPPRIAALAERILETMLAAYEDFNVRTIDSLMSAMIKVISPDLGLPPDFEIAVEMDPGVRQAAREFIADRADRDWPAMQAFLQAQRAVRGLPGWAPDEELALQVSRLFQLSLRQPLAPEGPTPEQAGQRLARRMAEFRRQLAALRESAADQPQRDGRCLHLNGQSVNAGLLEAIDRFLAGAETDRLAGLDRLLKRTFFAKSDPRDLLKAGAEPAYAGRFAAAYRAMREALAALLFERSRERTARFREFLAGFGAYWKGFPHPLFVGEFARELQLKLGEWRESAYPYLYLKLSDRLRHFLFDEFQDTSELQFQALAPLIDEALASEQSRVSLFIVGDRKQAIYRWRGGNADLMDEARLRRLIGQLDHLPPFSRPLEENWRSGRAIVEFNNRFWDPEAVAAAVPEGPVREAVRCNFADSCQRPHRRTEGLVEIRPLTATAGARGEERFQPLLESVAASVAEHRRLGWEAGDMAVLCRTNREVRRMVAHLSAAGIDCFSDQSLTLADHPVICDLVAGLRFLDYPPDDLSFYAFVRGAVFGRAAEAAAPGELAVFADEAVTGRSEPLYTAFRRLCPNLWRKLLEPHFRAVGFQPVYDLVSDLAQTFRLFGDFPGGAPYLLTFLDLLHELEVSGLHTVAAFLQAWEEDLANPQPRMVELPETASALRVMTIHQAKGLQFPLVILPLTDHQERNQPEPVLYRGELHLYDRRSSELSPALQAIEAGEIEKLLIDRLNLLYVGFTRPAQALIVPVLAPLQPPASPRRLGLASLVLNHPLLRDRGREPLRWGEPPPAPERRPPAPGLPPPLTDKRTASCDWQRDRLVFAPGSRPSATGRAGRLRGERIHRALAGLAAGGNLDELAAAHRLTADETGPLRRFLADPRLGGLFQPGAQVLAEKELAVPEAGGWRYRRVDQLVLEPGRVTVLEFKTGDRDLLHAGQVFDYLAALRAIYPDRLCRGLLVYVDSLEIEEVRC